MENNQMPKKLSDFIVGGDNPAYALKTSPEIDYPELPSLASYLAFKGEGEEQLYSSPIDSETLQLVPLNSGSWGNKIEFTFDKLHFRMARDNEHLVALPEEPIALKELKLVRWDLYLSESTIDGKKKKLFTDELTVITPQGSARSAFWTWIPTQ